MSKIVLKHTSCPNCPSSDAYCEYDDGHGYCFSCNYYKPKEDSLNEFTYEFLPTRGITKETFRHYGVKTKIDVQGVPISLGFPYQGGGFKVRNLSVKGFYWEGQHKPGLFGLERFGSGSHKYVIITEGELDALSLYQIVKLPVVSVQGASSAVADCVADRVWLAGFDRIYLAFDGDAAGREATAKVARLFDYNKVYHIKFSQPGRKDANDYLQYGEEELLLNIYHNARRYLPEQIISASADFRKILTTEHQVGIPYPFQSLNEMTYGIRTGESVLVTAQEGVGKTEFMHAIEYQLLKRTQDNVGAIFLEEPKRRHLQAIGGIELQSPVHLPGSGKTDEEIFGAVQAVVGRDERLYIYSHFGSDDPDVLLDTIRFLVSACACRYILLDHISMVVSGLGGDDERRALDYFSTRLEMMVKELDFALIFVSHVNDEGKTRGSRYISKVADIRIDLFRDIVTGSNTTSLLVSKNRFSGRTGPAGTYSFNPVTHLLSQDRGFANDNETGLSGQQENTTDTSQEKIAA